MRITDNTLGKDVEIEIEKVKKTDLQKIKKARSFQFDWTEFEGFEIFKLVLKDTNEILGLMCILDRPEKGFEYIEVNAIEVRLDQKGKNKRYDRIAGCLFGYAARMSVRNGYEGWMSLTAKTKTAAIFEKKYGFHHLGSVNALTPRMASDTKNSLKLIKEYVEN